MQECAYAVFTAIDDLVHKCAESEDRIEGILLNHADELHQIEKLNQDLRHQLSQLTDNQQKGSQPLILVPHSLQNTSLQSQPQTLNNS